MPHSIRGLSKNISKNLQNMNSFMHIGYLLFLVKERLAFSSGLIKVVDGTSRNVVIIVKLNNEFWFSSTLWGTKTKILNM